MTVTAPQQRLTGSEPGSSRAVQRRRSRRWLVVRVMLAAVVCLIMVFPLWVMVVTAFSGTAVFSQQLELWPRRFTLASFQKVFASWPVSTWFANSVLVSVITTVLSVIVSVTAGFAFAKLRFPGKTVMFMALLATMMIPVQATLVPSFRIVNGLGLIGTFWAVIIPGAAATFLSLIHI